MNKVLAVLTGIVIMMGSTFAYSFNTVLKSDVINVKASSSSDIFTVGDNTVTIELTDSKGNHIEDAEISVYYFMPSMPAMNYEVTSKLSNEKYTAVVKPTMPGKWAADIKVKKSGEENTLSVNFNAK